jgi:hypothetical protein
MCARERERERERERGEWGRGEWGRQSRLIFAAKYAVFTN